MEARFGMNLSPVRIHTGPQAARLNEVLHAHAFAVGEHIAFNAGSYQPESASGRFLLAHELAHVAQARGTAVVAETQPVRRGFWGDLYDSVADTLGDIADWAIDKVREFGWRLLESISPSFARTVRAIVDEGILSWLGRQVARAWDAYIGTLRALVPFDGPRQLIDLFAGLVERAAAIVAALASGNCEPLMRAIGEMKTFVTETVGVAWDRLTEFLRPIGDFFSGLWQDFGAPAIQWLRDFGGDVWEGIQQLGRDFWEWIRPVRDAASRVWNWFKDTLFGPAEGDAAGSSSGGVLGWITRKAGEAWDWVKTRTRPVWQPVADFATRVAELIPPAFVREMGEHAQQLSGELDTASAGMDGGDGVPESRDTLNAVLPSVQQIIATVRRIIVGAGQWLGERIAGVVALVTGLVRGLRTSDLLSWLAGAFTWLEEAVTALLSWAREKVAVLFNWLVQGFDALTPFLQLVLETVRKVIRIYSDLLQLPLLILNSIWQRVPACIRDPIENFIKNQILARIPVFGQFFTDPTLWPRVQQTALRILRRIFVDGDIAGAAWSFFQAVLGILGVPAQLVVQILAKAAGAIGSILTNPLGFLMNLLRAMGAGFTGFFSNIGRHLLTGFTDWLFSTVREAGINPPTDFSLRSVLGFVLEVLGVTVDNIFARLERRLDPTIVARLRRMLDVATGVWSFVATLVTEGPAGLWRELRERLSGLWNTVVEGVIGFITQRVIGWASRWLVSLLDVSGIMPVINTLIAIYRAIESFMEYLRQLLEIVNRVLDGIVGIARGAIDVAAGFLENALASALPVAIGFLANQAGLGRLSQRLREILGGLRARVDAAIDWLIDRALRLGQAVIDLARRGASAVRGAVGRVRDWWRARRGFQVGGVSHSVYVEGSGRSARVMLASNPTTYREFLDTVTVPSDKQAEKRAAVTIADELDSAIRTAANDNPTPGAADANPTSTNHADIIDGLLGRLANATATFMPVDITRSTDPVYGGRVNGFGSSASVFRLTPIHPNGSSPSRGDMGNPLWSQVAKRKQGEGVYYIKGHLLNDNLGGPGNTWDNLTPLTQAANSDHKNNFENPVKRAVNGTEGPYTQPTPTEAQARQLKSVNFVVTARYGQPSRTADITYLRAQGNPDANDKADIIEGEQAIPTQLDCSAHEVLSNGNAGPTVARHSVSNRIDTDLDHYATRPIPKRIVYLNEMSRTELLGLTGIGGTLADAIIRERPFRTKAQLQEKASIADGRWNQMQSTPNLEVRIYRR
jgi:phage-related protein